MGTRRTRGIVVLLTLAASSVLVAGALVAIGGAARGGEPGGTINASGQLSDRSTGQTFGFQLNMDEDMTEAGRGGTFFQLNGPSISACDAHGEGANTGSTPLASMQCGGSGGVSVSVDNCRAVFETHGIVHSDHPWTVFLGPVVLDVEFSYNPQQGSGELTVKIYTPKDVITIAGPTNGTVTMPTCS